MKRFKFNISGNNYDVEVNSLEDGVAKLEVNGTSYKVILEKEEKLSKTPVLRRSPLRTPTDAHQIKKTEGSLYKVAAPLPGVIMNILIKEGDNVSKSDPLLIYEAMKMENKLVAEKTGVVKRILVKPGDSVLQDDVLLEMELT